MSAYPVSEEIKAEKWNGETSFIMSICFSQSQLVVVTNELSLCPFDGKKPERVQLDLPILRLNPHINIENLSTETQFRINNQEVNTKQKLFKLEPNTYAFSFSRPGYIDKTEIVTVTYDRKYNYDLELLKDIPINRLKSVNLINDIISYEPRTIQLEM